VEDPDAIAWARACWRCALTISREAWLALTAEFENIGIAATNNTAMMAITVSSSIRLKAGTRRFFVAGLYGSTLIGQVGVLPRKNRKHFRCHD